LQSGVGPDTPIAAGGHGNRRLKAAPVTSISLALTELNLIAEITQLPVVHRLDPNPFHLIERDLIDYATVGFVVCFSKNRSGLSRSMLTKARHGTTRPYRKNRERKSQANSVRMRWIQVFLRRQPGGRLRKVTFVDSACKKV
jgi:hypothetical protein